MNLKSVALGLTIGIFGVVSSFATFAREKSMDYVLTDASRFDNPENVNRVGDGVADDVDVAALQITGRILSKGLCSKRDDFNDGRKKGGFDDSGDGLSGVLGGRRGKADGGFNEGYAEGGSGGIGGGFSGLLGGSGGGIATKARGTIKTPSARDIDMGAGGGSRSAADIMKVVRQRTPGLRHIYNKYLKKQPGFAGKVRLRFTIAPGGNIISISIASSTTGYGEFDNAVKNTVKRWMFSKIKSGNTTVTIPFTFSE